jgi:alpha-beta hydrolase superfamily lysophospholipase
MRLNKQQIFRFAKVFILIYAIMGIVLYYAQEWFLFHPIAIHAEEKFTFKVPFKELNIDYDSTTAFNLVEFSPTDTLNIRGIVLYFHGNRANINRYAPFAENFTKHGYKVLMPDYPSFGKSTGKLSEQLLYEEALQVYKLAVAKYSADSIILYGKSLGTGIASYVASKKNCQQLILETPYKSMTSLFNRYAFMYPLSKILHYKFPTIDYLKKVTAPITIFQGTDDWVVPYSNAIQLKSSFKSTDEFVTIEGASHNNINDFSLYHQKLDSLLK